MVSVGAVRSNSGVGGGVGPASDGVPLRLAPHNNHSRRDGVFLVLRAAALVPPPLPHRRNERHVRQAVNDRAARAAGRLLGCVLCLCYSLGSQENQEYQNFVLSL